MTAPCGRGGAPRKAAVASRGIEHLAPSGPSISAKLASETSLAGSPQASPKLAPLNLCLLGSRRERFGADDPRQQLVRQFLQEVSLLLDRLRSLLRRSLWGTRYFGQQSQLLSHERVASPVNSISGSWSVAPPGPANGVFGLFGMKTEGIGPSTRP